MTHRDEPQPRPRVYVEPWPAGGWSVWLEGDPAPLSRHDTEAEAWFRAHAYLRALTQGKELALKPESQ